MSKLARNSLLYLLTTLVLKGSSFLLLPLYTRLISPDEYGQIFLISTLSTFLATFLSLSVGGAVSRFYFENKEFKAVKEMYSSIVIPIFGFTLIAYIVFLIFANSIALFIDVKPVYLKLGLIASFFSIYYPIILSLLYAQQKGGLISIVSIISGIFSILLQVFLVLNLKDKILAFMIYFLMNAFVQFCIFLFFSKKYIDFKVKFINIKKYIRYSLNSLPGDISVWIITFADRLMLDKYKGHTDTGLYTIGYQMGQIPETLFHAINKAYVPDVFEKYSNLNKKNTEAVIKNATYLFALFTGTVFVLSVFSKEVVGILDTRYQNSLWIMIFILFSYLLNGYKLIFHNPLSYNVDFVKYKSWIWLGAAVLNICLNLWLIPKYSFYGAAIATFISYLSTLIPILFLSDKALKLKYPKRKYFIIIILSFIYFTTILLELSMVNFMIKIAVTTLYSIVLIKISGFDLYNMVKTNLKRN